MKVYIEFAGPPGSGKSTISSTISGGAKARAMRIYSCNHSLLLATKRGAMGSAMQTYLLRMLSVYAGEYMSFLVFRRSVLFPKYLSKFTSENKELINTLNRIEEAGFQERSSLYHSRMYCAVYQCIKEYLSDDESLFSEEGFVHNALALFAYSNKVNMQLLRAYAEAIPAPDILVIMQADHATCDQRVLVREKKDMYFLKHFTKKQRFMYYEKVDSVTYYIAQILQERGSNILLIDGTSKKESAVQEVTTFIGQRIGLQTPVRDTLFVGKRGAIRLNIDNNARAR